MLLQVTLKIFHNQRMGELCLMSCIFGENADIFFPKLNESIHLISFSEIAIRFLKEIGYEPHICKDENEARDYFELNLNNKMALPIYEKRYNR